MAAGAEVCVAGAAAVFVVLIFCLYYKCGDWIWDEVFLFFTIITKCRGGVCTLNVGFSVYTFYELFFVSIALSNNFITCFFCLLLIDGKWKETRLNKWKCNQFFLTILLVKLVFRPTRSLISVWQAANTTYNDIRGKRCQFLCIRKLNVVRNIEWFNLVKWI